MHCLRGMYIKKRGEEALNNVVYYPVKMVMSPVKARIIYFKSKHLQIKWLNTLSKIAGCANVFDFYEF